jgi:ubiquinone biosynthesis protein UbiJ
MSATRLFLAILNHLLTQAPWARARLSPHAGRHARLDLARLTVDFTIGADGLLVPSEPDSLPEVTLALPLGALILPPPGGLDALMAKAQISGSADLADALAFVLRHLRWDAEEDLAKFIGDIAAHRLVTVGERFAHIPRQLAASAAGNASGLLGKESAALLVARADGENLAADIRLFESALASLETRVAHLEKK